MAEWSGGAFDTRRDRLLVWGGGHSGYAGNELYAFDLRTLKWQRMTEPSRDIGGDPRTGYYPDGYPRSRHTYDSLEYVPGTDLFCAFGGAGLYPEGSTHAANVDCFDFQTSRWKRLPDAVTYGIGTLSAYDPVTGYVWVHGAGRDGFLAAFDVQNHKWLRHGTPGADAWVSYEMTAEIDPRRRLFVAVGGGHVYVKNIDASSSGAFREVETTGAADVVKARSPGLVYHPRIDRIVAWAGGPNLYTLDLDRLTWTMHPPAPSNLTVAPSITEAGIFGRFRYVPSKDVFVVTTEVNRNVFLYRLAAERTENSDQSPHR
jgi:hypothetical protein